LPWPSTTAPFPYTTLFRSPHNYLVHLTTGAIASVIGSIFLPALLNSEYTAVTFLVLVATQFREVRTVERETLSRLDTTLLVPRGDRKSTRLNSSHVKISYA